ncbi:MAG: hypothetical protein PHW63_04900 [Alphaproteobacteria bacterium]|nr:hypothetical protein [Alphaproteobacteria bacterium]
MNRRSSRYFDIAEKDIQIEEARKAEYSRRMDEYFDQLSDIDEEDEG